MIQLLARYKISCSLRGGPPLSGFWRSVVDRSPELRAFEQTARDLDRRLREEARARAPLPPHDLHASILEALRQADPPLPRRADTQSSPARFAGLRWALPIGTALLLALAFEWVRSPDPGNPSKSVPEGVIPAPATAVATSLPTPGALLAELQLLQAGIHADPFGREWEAFAQDARAAAWFLMASLP